MFTLRINDLGGMKRRNPGMVLTILMPLALVGCDDLLDVELPGRVTEASLTARVAETLGNSAIGEVESAWDSYVAVASVHSDEWTEASGNTPTKRIGLRQFDPNFEYYIDNVFTPLHVARAQANEFFERIQEFPDEEVPEKATLLAEIRAWGTWPLIALAEGMCGSPLDGGDEVLSSAQLFEAAEGKFTEAIQLAEQAGLSDLKYMALVGRSRARLGLEDYAGAIADAEMIPEGFFFVATREVEPGRRQNGVYDFMNGARSDVVGRKRASVTPTYWDLEWKGVDDPRVRIEHTGVTTYDFVSEHHRLANKISSPDEDVRLASWEEAQLFMAEAAAVTGQLSRARAILNVMHQRAGIPPVTEADIPTQEAVIRHVIQERVREFFAEGGHRLRDHLRWRGTEFEIPFLGEPGSYYPEGFDDDGERFGDTTCLPVPAIETQ